MYLIYDLTNLVAKGLAGKRFQGLSIVSTTEFRDIVVRDCGVSVDPYANDLKSMANTGIIS